MAGVGFNIKELTTMARPEPLVLHAETNNKNGKRTEVVAATDVWFVTYSGTPIGLRSDNVYKTASRKYRRTAFVNPGTAFNLAEELNKKFSTDLYEVRKATDSELVTENSGETEIDS